MWTLRMKGRKGDWERGRLLCFNDIFSPSPLPPLSHSSKKHMSGYTITQFRVKLIFFSSIIFLILIRAYLIRPRAVLILTPVISAISLKLRSA